MKNLTATLCMTLTILLGSVGCDARSQFQKGLDAAQSGDYVTAQREWTPLADKGSRSAQLLLGLMYLEGQPGVPRDYKTAEKWLRLSAEQGNDDAQFYLGEMYKNEWGVPQDDKAAVEWYKLAANQGNANAQYNLGVMYADGDGIEQTTRTIRLKTAVQWFTLASEQGNADAQANLGIMYEHGLGIARDYIYAYMWAQSAAAQGNELGKNLKDGIFKKMTSSQLEKAQGLARECVRKKYKDC